MKPPKIKQSENEIVKLIEKYADKSLEEPLNYFQWVEFVEDLKSLLKFYQEEANEITKGKTN